MVKYLEILAEGVNVCLAVVESGLVLVREAGNTPGILFPAYKSDTVWFGGVATVHFPITAFLQTRLQHRVVGQVPIEEQRSSVASRNWCGFIPNPQTEPIGLQIRYTSIIVPKYWC